MFQEVDFDEPVDTAVANTAPAAAAVKKTSSSPSTSVFVQFHKPGEEGFSVVAGACDDEDARVDAHFVSGDAWMSTVCHCIQCETLRVLTRFAEMQTEGQPSPVIVLMDLDNFGFNQFKSIPPYHDVELLDNVIVWAFFGSCFTRHHGKWPSDTSVCEPLPGRLTKSAETPKRSIWEILVQRRQVFFTPCGGQSQAADSVIQRVLHAVHGIDTVFLTGDVKLINDIYRSRRLLGMKSKRQHHEDEATDRLTVINVDDLEKRFVPVWRALCQRIRVCLQQFASSGSDDSEEGRWRNN